MLYSPRMRWACKNPTRISSCPLSLSNLRRPWRQIFRTVLQRYFCGQPYPVVHQCPPPFHSCIPRRVQIKGAWRESTNFKNENGREKGGRENTWDLVMNDVMVYTKPQRLQSTHRDEEMRNIIKNLRHRLTQWTTEGVNEHKNGNLEGWYRRSHWGSKQRKGPCWGAR